VVEVGGLFGLVRLSPYGQDNGRYENVQSDPKLNVGTRQSHALGPHTDTCWRLSLSGLVLMHCLKAHEVGGESLLVDGFKACERLRQEAPDSFDLLSRVPLKFGASVSNGDEYRGFGRLISLDAEGKVIGFRYNENSVRPLELPEDLVAPVYGALATWSRRSMAPWRTWRPSFSTRPCGSSGRCGRATSSSWTISASSTAAAPSTRPGESASCNIARWSGTCSTITTAAWPGAWAGTTGTTA
jgi:hypothetical protein